MSLVKVLRTNLGQSVAWLSALTVVAILWLAGALGASSGIVDDVRNDGPNAAGLDVITQNYYDTALEVVREPEFEFRGSIGKFLRMIRGKKNKPDAETWVAIAALGATENFEKGFRTHAFKPNNEVLHKGVTVKTNRWGHRDTDDYGKEKPAGTFRIALVGGSNSMGSGVEFPEMYPVLVEKRLNEELAGGAYERYELINLSVSKYHLLDRLYTAMFVAPEFDPDLIMVVVTVRDKRRGVHRSVAERLVEGRDLQYDFIKAIVELSAWKTSDTVLKAEQRLSRFNDDLCAGAFLALKQFSDDTGIPVVALVLRMEVNEIHADLRWQVQAAENAGLVALPIFEAFEGGDRDELQLLRTDFHPSVKGHRLLADNIYDELVNEPRLVPLLQP